MINPHSTATPGCQALIFCGPGLSLGTFTSNAEEYPKALIPIANRPMVWYPLEWCYRTGITNITLVLPGISRNAITNALSLDPHLTSLPLPKPTVLAPASITPNSGTAEILRIPEVQACITGDFLVLPCDLVCDIPGSRLIEAWLANESGIYDPMDMLEEPLASKRNKSGHAGLGVWYNTKSGEPIKSEQKDLIAVTPVQTLIKSTKPSSLLPLVYSLVYSAPMATVNDITSEKQTFPIRHALLKKFGRVNMKTSYRDAHLYFLPRWILDVVDKNESIISIAEDVIGWWAKSTWQPRLGSKLGFGRSSTSNTEYEKDAVSLSRGDQTALKELTTTLPLRLTNTNGEVKAAFASRVPKSSSQTHEIPKDDAATTSFPPILAYVQPKRSEGKSLEDTSDFVRRVDNSALLLSTSLLLAKLPASEDSPNGAVSRFSHASKIAYSAEIKKPSTVTKVDCLLADGVLVEEKAVIKESVIGTGCKIGQGARVNRCVLMEGAVVEDHCQLTSCILGRRCKIGAGSIMKDCEVQETYAIAEKTDAKNEIYMSSEGYDDDLEDDLQDEAAQG